MERALSTKGHWPRITRTIHHPEHRSAPSELHLYQPGPMRVRGARDSLNRFASSAFASRLIAFWLTRNSSQAHPRLSRDSECESG